MLSRDLAIEGWYPPVDVLRSVSRLATAVAGPEHLALAANVRQQLAVYARSEDLVRIGAYKSGLDPELDRSIALRPQMRKFMIQSAHQLCSLDQTLTELKQLATARSTP
jgi:flagellum-specific ATP synthase